MAWSLLARTLVVAAGVAFAARPAAGQTIVRVSATVETDPTPGVGDGADDPAVWIHPTSPSESLVVGTDKQAGLAVYGLDGRERQFVPGAVNNVDVRYQFPLGGELVDLVVTSRNADSTLGVLGVDPVARRLEDVAAGPLAAGIAVYGLCLYRSPWTGRLYAFVDSKAGAVRQFELVDDGTGRVVHRLVRSFAIGGETEGCVADDANGFVYIGEENFGIWRYGAEPLASGRTLVAATNPAGPLVADVEGLTIYPTANGGGYLIASSQGSSTYVVYDRLPPHAFRGRFRIVDFGGIDGTSDTDGIDVASVALGPLFPGGAFLAQDNENPGFNQNFKIVPWPAIAAAFAPPLAVDTGVSPRFATPPGACTNGADDDGDGETDYPNDPGCLYPYSSSEAPQCSDGADNDADGLADFGSDPDCRAAWDTREAAGGCGLGAELALAVPLLRALRSARRRTVVERRMGLSAGKR
jgi:3-phytase